MHHYITTQFADHIGTITFNNAKSKNSLCNELLSEMVEAFAIFEKTNARVVILRAPKGSGVWSSGFDIKQLPISGRDPLSYDDPLLSVLRAIQKFPAPVIAMVEGSVWGGACDMVFSCDLAIGCETAAFAITPAKIGVPYNSTGLIHFINVVGPRIAREMFYSARPLDAHRSYEVGILNRLVSADELEAETQQLASTISENSPLAISVIKEQLRLLSNSYPLQPETFERIQGLRRSVYDSWDYTEGRTAFEEKRKPVFRGE